MEIDVASQNLQWEIAVARIAGINHMAWLLEITENGADLYPEIKRKAADLLARLRANGHNGFHDMVRLEIMRHFGYYVTESSEHNAEYSPYWIKASHPGLID